MLVDEPITAKSVTSIDEFIRRVNEHYEEWGTRSTPWFRGEPADVPIPLLPTLFRPKKCGEKHQENKLLQYFRKRARIFHDKDIPESENTAIYLYLAQHHRLPTRLLDWTESALVALYFAVYEKLQNIDSSDNSIDNRRSYPTVWILNWVKLDSLVFGKEYGVDPPILERSEIMQQIFDPIWTQKPERLPELPVAIPPIYIHERMHAQRSCFTIHGNKDEGTYDLLKDKDILTEIEILIDEDQTDNIVQELRRLGISYDLLFPDLDGLAKDLKLLY